MTGSTDRATVDLSMFSGTFLDDPLGHYEQLRSSCPVVWSEPDQRWMITSHEAVRRVMQDHERFSNEAYLSPGRPPLLVLGQDPPIHTKYRRLLIPYFAPANTERLRPQLEAYSEELFDRFVESGEADLVLDYGNPLPALLVLEQCGLPTDQWWDFAEPNHAIQYETPGTKAHKRALAGMRWIAEQLYSIAAERRAAPNDDLTSHLANARVDGELLPLEDVAGILMTVVGGGVDTTTSLYANAIRYLHYNPDDRDRLIHEPALISEACEEFLRHYAPAQAMSRCVVGGDIEIEGQALRDGEVLHVAVVSANHDPEVFDHPDDVIIDRPANRHTSFGLGIHRCVGSHLGRALIHTMIRHTLERVPDFAIDEAGASHYRSPIVNGWKTMPVSFTPSTPSASTSILPLP